DRADGEGERLERVLSGQRGAGDRGADRRRLPADPPRRRELRRRDVLAEVADPAARGALQEPVPEGLAACGADHAGGEAADRGVHAERHGVAPQAVVGRNRIAGTFSRPQVRGARQRQRLTPQLARRAGDEGEGEDENAESGAESVCGVHGVWIAGAAARAAVAESGTALPNLSCRAGAGNRTTCVARVV